MIVDRGGELSLVSSRLVSSGLAQVHKRRGNSFITYRVESARAAIHSIVPFTQIPNRSLPIHPHLPPSPADHSAFSPSLPQHAYPFRSQIPRLFHKLGLLGPSSSWLRLLAPCRNPPLG